MTNHAPNQPPYPATLWDVLMELREIRQRRSRRVTLRNDIDREVQADDARIAALEELGMAALKEYDRACGSLNVSSHVDGPDNSVWQTGRSSFREIPITRSLDVKVPVAVATKPDNVCVRIAVNGLPSTIIKIPPMPGSTLKATATEWSMAPGDIKLDVIDPGESATDPSPSLGDQMVAGIDRYCDQVEAALAAEAPAVRNVGRLTWAAAPDGDYPYVAGTIIPASVVVGLIEGGMSPSAVQRVHPELTAADVTACMDWADEAAAAAAKNGGTDR